MPPTSFAHIFLKFKIYIRTKYVPRWMRHPQVHYMITSASKTISIRAEWNFQGFSFSVKPIAQFRSKSNFSKIMNNSNAPKLDQEPVQEFALIP
jgi:hypothetical protein